MTVEYKGKLEITGHSKAGGQAAAAATVSGLNGYSFNALNVDADTLKPYGKKREDALKVGPDGNFLVKSFIFPYDGVSALQDNKKNNIYSSSIGQRYTVPPQDINGQSVVAPEENSDLIEYHSMSYIINSMEKQMQDDLKTIARGLGCT